MTATLLLILLLEGFVTISLEILTIRQLTPFYGNSIIISSIIIGIFLLFLALGYWRGGMHNQDFYKKLRRNFSLSMGWAGIGLSYTFISLVFYAATLKFHLPFILSLTVYLLLILAPVVYWLGQTIPITTNLFNQQLKVGKISGRALFFNTVGSFLGAIITSLIFFHYLGIAWSLVIDCILLYALAITLRKNSQLQWSTIVLLAIVLWFIKALNVNVDKNNFQMSNNYANYKVFDKGLDKFMQINLATSSKLSKDKQSLEYIEYIRNLLFNQLNLQQKKILVIGAGGFTLTANGSNNNEVTYIDIDPQIKQFAENNFLNKPINGKFIGQDARQFLNQNRQKFDVIITDVYDHQSNIPPALLTKEYFQKLQQTLNPEGILIANLISNPFFNDKFSQVTDNTIRNSLGYCATVPLNWQKKLTNIIYICPNQQTNTGQYTDNLTTATMDFFKSWDKAVLSATSG